MSRGCSARRAAVIGRRDDRPPHLLLVEARYYTHIADAAARGRRAGARRRRRDARDVEVPGAFEIPARSASPRRRATGSTAMSRSAASSAARPPITTMSARRARAGCRIWRCATGLPIGFGILTCRERGAGAGARPGRRPRQGRRGGARLSGDGRAEAPLGAGRRMSAAGATPTREGRQRAAAGGAASPGSAAVQALYQLELNPGARAEAVVREFVRTGSAARSTATFGEADAALFADIVRGVARHRERLDDDIAASLSEEWPLAPARDHPARDPAKPAPTSWRTAGHPAAGDDQRIHRHRPRLFRRQGAGARQRRARPPRPRAARRRSM